MNCFWPGRNQMIKSENEHITYYIDGAHTVESINQFVEWFREVNPNSDNEKNVLLFNYTGERDVHIYMKLLVILLIFYKMISIYFLILKFSL